MDFAIITGMLLLALVQTSANVIAYYRYKRQDGDIKEYKLEAAKLRERLSESEYWKNKYRTEIDAQEAEIRALNKQLAIYNPKPVPITGTVNYGGRHV